MTNPTPDTPTSLAAETGTEPLEAAIEAAGEALWNDHLTEFPTSARVPGGGTPQAFVDYAAVAVRAAAPILLAPVEQSMATRDAVCARAIQAAERRIAELEDEADTLRGEIGRLIARLAAGSDAHHEGFGEGVKWSGESWERTLAKLRADAERDTLLRAADAAEARPFSHSEWWPMMAGPWLRERAKAGGDE